MPNILDSIESLWLQGNFAIESQDSTAFKSGKSGNQFCDLRAFYCNLSFVNAILNR